jgi:cathepsin L
LEGYHYLRKNKLVEVSVQQIIDCSSSESVMSKTGSGRWNEGCTGGYLENAFEFATEYEVFDELSYPYKGYDNQCKQTQTRPKSKIKLPAISTILPDKAHGIKKVLKRGPVAASISASSPIFKFHAMGIIDD